MIQKKFLLGVFILLFHAAIAQTPVQNKFDLPSFVPPSPELATLANLGQVNNTLHTGTASVNIPLMEFTVGNLKLPVAISYATNGIRVNDIASRVGLGWNLIAGGSITCTIRDEPDLHPSTNKLPDYITYTTAEAQLGYLTFANMAWYDTETDEFNYNVNGMSGKFYFDREGNIRQCEHTNIEIIRNGNDFILTTADGVKYYFGSSETEVTEEVKINDVVRHNNVNQTGWFLYKIQNLEGDVITFDYEEVTTRMYMGKGENVVLYRTASNYVPYMDCSFCGEPGNLASPFDNSVIYHTRYLKGIVGNNNSSIVFNHVPRPAGDQSSDVRVNNIAYTKNGTLIQNYSLEYTDYTIADDVNQRFYLSKLKSNINTSPEVLVYHFEYNDPGALPSQKSMKQDWFGYYNGTTNPNNATHFFPLLPTWLESQYNYANLGADRSHNFDFTKKGSLKKVIYPTGGSQEFIYEPHMKTVQNASSYSYTSTETFDIASTSSQYGPESESRIYNVSALSGLQAPKLKLTFKTSATTYTPPGPHGFPWTHIRVINEETGGLVSLITHREFTSETLEVEVDANVDHRVEITSYNRAYRATVQVDYNQVAGQIVNVEVPSPGMRVKQIVSFEPLKNQYHNKYFFYSSLYSLASYKGLQIEGQSNIPTSSLLISSGTGANQLYNAERYIGGGFCRGCIGACPFIGYVFYEDCSMSLLQVNSSSVSGTSTYGGSPIAYHEVIEADDPELVNGGTLHKYKTDDGKIKAVPIYGMFMPGALAGSRLNWDGKEVFTAVFKKTANKYVVLKEVTNQYQVDRLMGSPVNSYSVRCRVEPSPFTGPPDYYPPLPSIDTRFKAWDCSSYAMSSQWAYLKSTTTKTYDENGSNPLIQTITYNYSDPNHTQPASVVSTNSENEIVSEYFRYPADVPEPVYQDMVRKHVISPVVFSKKAIRSSPTSDEKLLSTITTEYSSYPSSYTQFFRPSKMLSQKGEHGLEENRLRYNKYDIKGNLMEVFKEGGSPLSYLWYSKDNRPLAEATNALNRDVAATSFESIDKGNWNYNESGLHADGLTGNHSFIGQMTANVDANQTYIVMLAARTDATVNGQPGTVVKTIQGFNILKWEISGTSTIEVLSTDIIDEVRLFPTKSLISTYTYKLFGGVGSVCDAAYNITYYEYDHFNRLATIKDENKNIIKKMEYHYGL